MVKNHVTRFAWVALWVAALATTLAGCAGNGNKIEEYQGVVEFDERNLAFELGGRLSRIEVQEGDLVEAGQPLAVLDDSLEKPAREARAAEVRALQAQVDLIRAGSRHEDVRAVAAQLRGAREVEAIAKSNLKRQRRLVDSGALPEATLDPLQGELSRVQAERQALEQRLQALRNGARPEELRVAEARLEAATAALAAIDERLARYALVAPTEGEIVDVHLEAGEVTGPGTPVIVLADTRHPYADVFVAQGKLEGIRVGCRASLRVDAADHAFAARVEDVGRRTEFTPRFLFSERERPNLVIRVRVRIDDPEGELHAGVPAFVHIERGSSTEGKP